MKKRAAFIYIICISLLGGCSSGSIYSNYREIEHLLVVQTIGFDLAADGQVVLSVSTGKIGGEPPVRLWAQADTIAGAEDILQDYALDKELFYPHVGYIVVGQRAAEAGIGGVLDFVARSVETRIDTPLLVVREGEAKELVLEAGGENYGVTEALETLRRSIEKRGGGGLYSVADLIRALQDGGGGILCALRLQSEALANPRAEDGALAAVPAGYAVFRGERLAGFVPEEAARGVGLLKGSAGCGDVDLAVDGQSVSVSVNGGGCRFEPAWNEDGSVKSIAVRAEITAGLGELREPARLSPEFQSALNGALCLKAQSWVETTLRISQSLGSDFLGLGRVLETACPEKYRAMPEPFSKQLSRIVFTVAASADIQRSYDLSNPSSVTIP